MYLIVRLQPDTCMCNHLSVYTTLNQSRFEGASFACVRSENSGKYIRIASWRLLSHGSWTDTAVRLYTVKLRSCSDLLSCLQMKKAYGEDCGRAS